MIKEKQKKMKRISFLTAPVLACILAFLMGYFVHAAASDSLTLPLSITWGEKGLREDETYELSLEGLTADCPMPKGSEKEYQVRITKKESIDHLPTLSYEKPGDYTYQLTLKRQDGTQVGIYYLHVMAAYGENDKLTVSAAIRKDKKDGAKTDTIHFTDPAEKKAITEEKKSSSKSSGTSTKTPASTGSTVQTGDVGRPEFWAGAILLGCTGLFFTRKKLRTKSREA